MSDGEWVTISSSLLNFSPVVLSLYIHESCSLYRRNGYFRGHDIFAVEVYLRK